METFTAEQREITVYAVGATPDIEWGEPDTSNYLRWNVTFHSDGIDVYCFSNGKSFYYFNDGRLKLYDDRGYVQWTTWTFKEYHSRVILRLLEMTQDNFFNEYFSCLSMQKRRRVVNDIHTKIRFYEQYHAANCFDPKCRCEKIIASYKCFIAQKRYELQHLRLRCFAFNEICAFSSTSLARADGDRAIMTRVAEMLVISF